MKLRLETRPVHETGHGVKRLLDDVLDLACNVRHESNVRLVKRSLVNPAHLREHSLDIADIVEDRAEQHLVTLLPWVIRSFHGRDLVDDRHPLTLEFREQFVDQVFVE